jgi:hypothetical protein
MKETLYKIKKTDKENLFFLMVSTFKEHFNVIWSKDQANFIAKADK